jgi:hypothetical protein
MVPVQALRSSIDVTFVGTRMAHDERCYRATVVAGDGEASQRRCETLEPPSWQGRTRIVAAHSLLDELVPPTR